MPPELKFQALLHDSAEAYTNDISRPLKHSLKLLETEETIRSVILEKYGIPSISRAVREADNILLATEARDLMSDTLCWAKLPDPLPTEIHPWPWWTAERLFLERFEEYNKGAKQ